MRSCSVSTYSGFFVDFSRRCAASITTWPRAITFLGLLTFSACHADPPSPAVGKSLDLRRAQGFLGKGDFQKARELCIPEQASPAVRPWVLLCKGYAEAGLGNTSSALQTLAAVPTTSAASLAARALRTELDTTVSTTNASAHISEIRKQASSHNIVYAESQLLVSEARVTGNSSPVRALELLRSVRQRSPLSPAGERARLLTAKLPDDLPQDLKHPAEGVRLVAEIEALAAERDGAGLNKLMKRYPLASLLRVLTINQWHTVLEALHKGSQDNLVDYLASSANSQSSASPSLTGFKEAAGIFYWKRSRYADAIALSRELPEETPGRALIEGRVADSKGELPKARAAFGRYLRQADGNADIGIAFRALMLSFFAMDTSEARSIAANIQQLKAPSNDLDRTAIEYWTSKALESPLEPQSKDHLHGAPSYYPTLSNADALVSLSKRPSKPPALSTCKLAALKLSDDVIRAVKALVAERYTLEAATELKYAIPRGTGDVDAILRAREISEMVGPRFAWSDLAPKTMVTNSPCQQQLYALLYPNPYPDLYERAGAASGIPYELALAITRTESAFDPEAKSGANALGLMQLLLETAKRNGYNGTSANGLFEPATNIELGSKYLMSLYEKFNKRWYLAIAAYNAGPKAVEGWIQRYPNARPELFVELIPYSETRTYVKKVTEAAYHYRWLYDHG